MLPHGSPVRVARPSCAGWRNDDGTDVKHGWDPRRETGEYAFFRVVPSRVQAWREVNELDGRTLLRDGRWIA